MKISSHISILMTAYNREQFIGGAIDSVLHSTYQNWELIISDDCSTDSTVSIAKSYAYNDKRIKVYVNEKNLGDYPNRNKAASYATGDYLKYLDSDDTMSNDAIERMINFMELFPDASLGISNFLPGINENTLPVCLDKKSAYEFHYFNQPIFFASPGLSIIKRKAFEKAGGFSEKRMVSDFDMWHKLADYSPVVFMPGNIINIRQHPNQEIRDRHKYAVEYEKVKMFYLHNASCPLSLSQIQAIKNQRRTTVLKIAIRKLIHLNIKEAIPRLKVFWFYVTNRSISKGS